MLLHLLKAILVRCGIVLIVLVLILKVRYVVIKVHVSSAWDVALTMRAIILVVIIHMSLISRWASVALRDSINVGAEEVAALRAYGAAGCS